MLDLILYFCMDLLHSWLLWLVCRGYPYFKNPCPKYYYTLDTEDSHPRPAADVIIKTVLGSSQEFAPIVQDILWTHSVLFVPCHMRLNRIFCSAQTRSLTHSIVNLCITCLNQMHSLDWGFSCPMDNVSHAVLCKSVNKWPDLHKTLRLNLASHLSSKGSLTLTKCGTANCATKIPARAK